MSRCGSRVRPTEARDRFDAVRQAGAPAVFGGYAGVRLAQIDLEAREFAQARATAENLLAGTLPPAQRAAALLIAGEASYGLREYDRAASFYTRYLAELPQSPSSPLVRLALGWAELRRGRLAAARQEWERFAASFRMIRACPPCCSSPPSWRRRRGRARRRGCCSTASSPAIPTASRPQAATPEPRRAGHARRSREAAALRDLEARPAGADLAVHRPDPPGAGHRRCSGAKRARRGDGVPGALAEGEELAHLGLGVVALARGQWDEATREWLAARDAGAAPAATAAEYGLAAVAFGQGKLASSGALAAPLLAGPPDPATTPGLLQGMAYLAGEEKKWPEARALTLRVADEFGKSRAAPAALATLGAPRRRGAGNGRRPRGLRDLIATRYAGRHIGAEARLDHAEALLRTGAAPEARQRLEAFVNRRDGRSAASARAAPPRAELRGRRREGQGAGHLRAPAAGLSDRRRVRSARPSPGPPAPDGREVGRGAARLQRALDDADPTMAAEAAFRLGEGLAPPASTPRRRAYMTAAYLAPRRRRGPRALLGAGQSFGALKQSDAAEIVYRKLVTAKGVEPELAEAARKELRALGAN